MTVRGWVGVAALTLLAPLPAGPVPAVASDLVSGGGARAGGNVRLVDRLGPVVAGRSVAPGNQLVLETGLAAIPSQAVAVAWLSLGAAWIPGPAGDRLRISWILAPDSDPAGLFVERAVDEAGPYVRLHDGALPAGAGEFEDAAPPVAPTLWYRLAALDRAGELYTSAPLRVEGRLVPPALAVRPPTPNPSSTGAALALELPVAGPVTLRVYDVQGRLVAAPLDAALPAGSHRLFWDGQTDRGAAVSGLYFLRLTAAGQSSVFKLVIRR